MKLRDLTYENFPGEAGDELRAAHKGFLQWKAETPDWKAQLRAKRSKADPLRSVYYLRYPFWE